LRLALGIDKALEEISKNKGILYDPEVVSVCLKLFKKKDLNLNKYYQDSLFHIFITSWRYRKE
jgi:HD-GYP domain-containing protein (c-di-GMP phosphodiesterase class II)